MGLELGTAAVIGAGIAAAGNTSAAVIAGGRGRRSQKRAFRYNKQLAQYQYDLNMQGWREQMAYNSPAAQMQRYREAGLNPRLMYGQGDSGNATSIPQYQAPEAPVEMTNDYGIAEGVNKAVSTWLQMKQFEEVQKNNMVSREKMQLEGLSEIMQQLRYGQDYAKNNWEFRELQRLGMSQAAVMASNINATQQQIRESSQRVLNLQQEYELAKLMNPIKVDMANQELVKLKQTNDWNSFEYAMRKRLNLLPDSTPWDRIIDFGLEVLEKGADSRLMKAIDKIRLLISGKEELSREEYIKAREHLIKALDESSDKTLNKLENE